jgi:hypothetical protein
MLTIFIILHCPSITQNEAQFWIRCARLLYGHDILPAVLLKLISIHINTNKVTTGTWYNPNLYKLYVGQSKNCASEIKHHTMKNGVDVYLHTTPQY